MMQEYERFMDGKPANMSFHLISDTHLVSNSDSEEAEYFKTALQDMKEINPNAQAFLTAGDNTQDGKEKEMKVFYDILDAYNPVGDDQTMIALGNHDVRDPNSSDWETHPVESNAYWSTIYNLYMEHNSKYMPDTQGKTYYDRWIGGYHFIVLNPENAAKDTAWMTQTQLDWLEEKLSENEEVGKPAFVIIHQALNDTHRGSNNYLGFGNSDAQVKEILSRHPQTIFISGHIHNGMGVAEVMTRGYGTLVDVPSFRWNSNGITGAGMGYEVYLYDTEMYMRARDFVKHEWVPEFDISIKIPTLSSLCKQIEELEQKDYTEESWNMAKEIFDEVLPRAKEMLNLGYGNYNAETHREINFIQEEMKEGLTVLISEKDKRLDLLMQKAEELLNKTEKYTENSVQALREALEAAKETAEKENASEQEIDDAYDALAKAITSLERVANKTELFNVLNKAEDILSNAGKYTAGSLEGLKEAKDVARTVYDDKNVKQADIAEVLKNLINEILEVRILGDVNQDEKVDSADAQTILRYSAEMEDLSAEQIEGADVNRDKAADSSDAGMILQYMAEMITEF